MNNYNINILDTDYLFTIKGTQREKELPTKYNFGDTYGEDSDLAIITEFYSSDIVDITCYKMKYLTKFNNIEEVDKTDLTRREDAPFFPYEKVAERYPNFYINYSESAMKVGFKEGKPKSYYEDDRLETFYDEDNKLLFFIIKNLTEEEYNKIEEYKKKQYEEEAIGFRK